jgi:hypothetical protein
MLFHILHPIHIPKDDDSIYTDHYPSCSEITYPDIVDPALVAQVAQQIQDGLLTPDEAKRTVQGRQL